MRREQKETAAAKINVRAWENPSVAASYANEGELLAAEQAILERVAPVFRGERILDLGVGGGRTVRFLRAISTDYVALDLSPAMVAACRSRYPDVEVLTGDAADLLRFRDGEFGLVVFSFNGIDNVSHRDRLRVLSEVRRVLRRGGAFVFSTHNRLYRRLRRFEPELELSWNPARMLVRTVRLLTRYLRHLSRRRFEVETAEFALINDSGEDYAFFVYYISPESQRRQLTEAGFTGKVTIFDTRGREVAGDEESPWLYYLVEG